MQKIELLAPAGNFESLKAAVEAGADAVYLAGDQFGARAYAGNFSNEDLEKAVTFAHLRGVKVHVTVNTIIADDEIEDLKRYLQFLTNINVDAILVQDLGVALIAAQIVPEMSLHASTQMTVHSLEGVKALEGIGFERVVLARELSLDEIKYICTNSSAEIEVFMHGALCICYSGQCLMSSMIGARSGNRGKCAQPCRLPYELVDENGNNLLKGQAGQYLLSPKDLNTIDILPQLINAGVSSLKIEGRMKRPEYVATVVKTYRNAIDRYYDNPQNYSSTLEERRNLSQIFNRDFTTAYLEHNQGRHMISDMKPNNRGLSIGRITSIDKEGISIKITENINEGDQLEIWVKIGGRVTITVKDFSINGNICTVRTSENVRGVKVHDRVFKVFDAKLTEHARKFFTSAAPIRKIPISGTVSVKTGEPLKLRLTLDDFGDISVETSTKFITEPAKNRPLTNETIYKQLERLGNSIFKLDDVVFDIDDNVMVPVSEINDVRRRAIEQLENELLKISNIRRISDDSYCIRKNLHVSDVGAYRSDGTKLIVHVDTIDLMRMAIKSGADEIIFGGESYHHSDITPQIYQQAIEIAHKADIKIYIATPRIVRDNEQTNLENILNFVTSADGVYVHNIATLHLVKRISDLPIRSDFSLITFNLETIKFLREFGVESATLSPELTFLQVKKLVDNSPLPLECIVHGKLELMISSYCPIGSFIGGVGEHVCSRPCEKKSFYLRDRKSAIFPIVTDQFCRMHILNSKTLSMLPHAAEFKKIGISKIRIDGRAMSTHEIESTIKKYRLSMSGESVIEGDGVTRGHYFRGVV